MKVCTQCKEMKDLLQFGPRKDRREGSTLSRCRECMRDNVASWKTNNPDKVIERNKRYYWENLVRETERNRLKSKTRDWAPKNNQRRSVGKVDWSKEMIVDTYGLSCHLCDSDIDHTLPWPNPFSFTVDHVIPISKGGTNDFSNVRPAHARCNFSKGNKVY